MEPTYCSKYPRFTTTSAIRGFNRLAKDRIEGEGMGDKITQLRETIMPLVPLQKSAKHMSERDLGRLEPTPSLQYRVLEVQARAG